MGAVSYERGTPALALPNGESRHLEMRRPVLILVFCGTDPSSLGTNLSTLGVKNISQPNCGRPRFRAWVEGLDFIRTTLYNQYSGSTKITTHLDHTGHCKTTSGSNWSRRQTYRVLSHQHSPRLDFGSGLKFSCLRVGGWGLGLRVRVRD